MSKKIAKEVLETSEDTLTLEAYAKEAKVHPGLVASFKVENASEGLEPRNKEAWDEAFEAQSNKVYK